MKKFLSILLALTISVCVGVMFGACGSKDPEQQKWEAMMDDANFENYTFTLSVDLVSEDLPESSGHNYVLVKIADGMVYFREVWNRDESNAMSGVYTGEHAQIMINSYEQVFRTLLNDYENFVYDEEGGFYINNGTVTVSVPGIGAEASLSMDNGKVYLTEDGKLLKFVCDYTQTTTVLGSNGNPEFQFTQQAQDSTWIFSDYGTTVID